MESFEPTAVNDGTTRTSSFIELSTLRHQNALAIELPAFIVPRLYRPRTGGPGAADLDAALTTLRETHANQEFVWDDLWRVIKRQQSRPVRRSLYAAFVSEFVGSPRQGVRRVRRGIYRFGDVGQSRQRETTSVQDVMAAFDSLYVTTGKSEWRWPDIYAEMRRLGTTYPAESARVSMLKSITRTPPDEDFPSFRHVARGLYGARPSASAHIARRLRLDEERSQA